MSRLSYRRYASKAAQAIGRRASLTIQHGLLGNKNNFATLCASITAHPALGAACSDIYALDAVNHGESPHAATHNVELVSTGLEEFFATRVGAAHGGAANVAMGHSMGGAALMNSVFRCRNRSVAAAVAADNAPWADATGAAARIYADGPAAEGGAEPPPITAAIIVDVCPQNGDSNDQPSTFAELGPVLAALVGLPLVGPEAVRDHRDADARLRASIPDNALRGFLLTNLVFPARRRGHPGAGGGADADAPFWRANVPLLARSLPRLLFRGPPTAVAVEPSDLPVLFVFGGDSPYNTAEGRARIPRFFSSATMVDIPNAGHFVHHEKREEFLAAIAPFLQEQLLRR